MDKNLIQRLITGTIFVVVLVSAIWFSYYAMAGLFLLIVILGLREFYGMAEKTNAHPPKTFGIIFGTLILFLTIVSKLFDPNIGFFILPIIFLPFFVELYRKKENPFANIGWTLLGWIYIVVPFGLLLINFMPKQFFDFGKHPYWDLHSYFHETYDPRPILLIFVLIWISDSMAYVCGRIFGKHKLFERISPKKTWEGFIGGLIFTVAAAGAISKWILFREMDTNKAMHWICQMEMIKWICVAAVISITGMLGDLVESLFKRSIGVKDSGTILPGHGGILDRFDALLLATPFALFTIWICDYLAYWHSFH